MLSIELQHAIYDILARTNTGDPDGIDSADILQIGSLFGSLNDIQRHLTRQHQRRLLLQILTFRHLVPIWDRYLPGDHRLCDDLDSMVSLVLKRLSLGQAQQALDTLWDHIESYPRFWRYGCVCSRGRARVDDITLLRPSLKIRMRCTG